jgi:tight adherence protein F
VISSSMFKYKRVNQKGNFTVEFAIVGVFFSLLIVFSGDLVIKLAMKGKLDRMSYSAASILKERKQLFSNDFSVKNKEANAIYSVVEKSLIRTVSNFDVKKFSFDISTYELDGSNTVSESFSYTSNHKLKCTKVTPDKNLFLTTSWGNNMKFYQTTLCYETSNWFGSLIGETFNRVQSYSIVMGR